MAVLNTVGGGAFIDGTSPLGVDSFSFTIAAWVKRSADHSGNNGYIAVVGNSAGADNQHTIMSNGVNNPQIVSQQAGSGNAAITNITTNISTSTWIPIIGTFESRTVRRIYNNSTSASNTSTDTGGFTSGTNSINSSTGRFAVGRRPNSTSSLRFQGLVAHVAVWKKVLSSDEIADFRAGNNPLTIANTDLLAYYADDFYEEGGDWYYEDKSGNEWHLLLESGAVRTDGDAPTVNDPPSTGLAFTVAPTVTSRTTTAYTIGGTTNQDCTVFAVATETTATDPDGPQIAAGTDGDDAAAPGTGSVAATANTAFSLNITGTFTEATHDIHIVARREAE